MQQTGQTCDVSRSLPPEAGSHASLVFQ